VTTWITPGKYEGTDTVFLHFRQSSCRIPDLTSLLGRVSTLSFHQSSKHSTWTTHPQRSSRHWAPRAIGSKHSMQVSSVGITTGAGTGVESVDSATEVCLFKGAMLGSPKGGKLGSPKRMLTTKEHSAIKTIAAEIHAGSSQTSISLKVPKVQKSLSEHCFQFFFYAFFLQVKLAIRRKCQNVPMIFFHF